MNEFNHNGYYVIDRDKSIEDAEHNLFVSPLQGGQDLIAEYYRDKYGAHIVFPKRNNVIEFVGYIQKTLASDTEISDKSLPNFRKAFFVGASSTHATPIVYIRENGEEGFLWADSKGVNEWAVQTLQELSGINVYAVENPRQGDMYSCYTDALVLARDTTAKDPITGKYRIPNLLSTLKKRSTPKKGYSVTKLPEELLKTSQLSSFTEEHRESTPSTKIIHKNQTLDQFRQRYTDKNLTIRNKKNETEVKDVPTYARKKGIKFANIIEIQFWVRWLNNQYGAPLRKSIREQFIKAAKTELASQGEPGTNRKGLGELAKTYLESSQNSETKEKKFMADETQSGKGKEKKETNLEKFKREFLELENQLNDKRWIDFINWKNNTLSILCVSTVIQKARGWEIGQQISAQEAIAALNQLNFSDYWERVDNTQEPDFFVTEEFIKTTLNDDEYLKYKSYVSNKEYQLAREVRFGVVNEFLKIFMSKVAPEKSLKKLQQSAKTTSTSTTASTKKPDIVIDGGVSEGDETAKPDVLEKFQKEILQLQAEIVDKRWVGFISTSTYNPITLICASPLERSRHGLHHGRGSFQPTSAREAINILNKMDYSEYGWDLQVNHTRDSHKAEDSRKEKLMSAFALRTYPKLLESNTSDHTYRSMQFTFKNDQNHDILKLSGATMNLQDRCVPSLSADPKKGYYHSKPANNPWNYSEKGNPKSFEDEKYKARKLKQIDKIINDVISGKDFLLLQEIDFLYKNGETEKELRKIFEKKLVNAGLWYLQTPETIGAGSQQPLAIVYNFNKITPVLSNNNDDKAVGQPLFPDENAHHRGYEWRFTRVDDPENKQFAITGVHLNYQYDYNEAIVEYKNQQKENNIPTIIAGDTNHPITAKEIPGALGNPNKTTNLGAVNEDSPDGRVTRLDHRYENDIYAKLDPKSYDTFFASSVDGGKVIAEELDGECFEFQANTREYTIKKTSLLTTFAELSEDLKALLTSEKFKDKVKKHAGLRELNTSSPTLFQDFLDMCKTKKHWSESFGAFCDYAARDGDIQKLYVLGKKYNASKNDPDIRKFEKHLYIELAEYGNKKGQLSPNELKGTYISFK